jgi:hypothetical protein
MKTGEVFAIEQQKKLGSFISDLLKALEAELLESHAIPQMLEILRGMIDVFFDELIKLEQPKGIVVTEAIEALKAAVDTFIEKIEEAFRDKNMPPEVVKRRLEELTRRTEMMLRV